jgi:hypothetical protein
LENILIFIECDSDILKEICVRIGGKYLTSHRGERMNEQMILVKLTPLCNVIDDCTTDESDCIILLNNFSDEFQKVNHGFFWTYFTNIGV